MKRIVMVMAGLAIAAAQEGSKAIVINPASTAWTHGKRDPAGVESVFLRQDPETGGLELLVRFPAGHKIAPHWHDCNERIVVLEGQLLLRPASASASGETALDAGSFAFLPSREVQRLSCGSKSRCTFYLAWDGKPGSHPAE